MSGTDAGRPRRLFRQEALAHFADPEKEGEVLRLDPRWVRWACWVLISAMSTALGILGFASVYHYATGRAVILAEGRIDIVATEPGVVAQILARPGERVVAGQPLVRLHDEAERAEVARLRRELDALLARMLLSPTEPALRQSAASLEAALRLAESRLALRTLAAPCAGCLTDLRIRPGQALQSGEVAASLSEQDRFVMLALLPGQFRPQLRVGQSLRLELDGYRFSYQELTIRSIGSEVLSPSAAQRALRHEVADSLRMDGPVVLVEAVLPGSTFETDRESYPFADGMLGTAEVRLRRERLLFVLLPALRSLHRAPSRGPDVDP